MILNYLGSAKIYINHKGDIILVNDTSKPKGLCARIAYHNKPAIIEKRGKCKLNIKIIHGGILIENDKSVYITCISKYNTLRKIRVDYVVILRRDEDVLEIRGRSGKRCIRPGDYYDLTNDRFIEKIHTMKVEKEFFRLLISGLKKVEGRLYDDKRRSFKEGDYIKLVTNDGDEAYFLLVAIEVYSSFKEMLKTVGLKNVLPNVRNIQEGISVYRRFYSEDEEKRYGVCALYLKPL